MAAVPGISQVSVRDVPISETGLGARAVAGKKWAERVTVETFDVRGDELTGRTVIVIDSASGFDQLQSAAGKPAFVDVERGPVARPTAAIWAGEQINGGALCTLGFGVIKAGIKYTTTAAHSPCNIADTYQYGGTLPTQFSQFGGSSDLSIRNTGANLATNTVYDGSTARSITATRSRSAMSVGNFVCHYGRTTGYGCGYVDSTTIAPGYIPGATATYIKVSGCPFSNSLGDLGDSGGPWFSSSTAWGWQSGASGPNSCGINDGIFMAANYVSNQGASILTS